MIISVYYRSYSYAMVLLSMHVTSRGNPDLMLIVNSMEPSLCNIMTSPGERIVNTILSLDIIQHVVIVNTCHVTWIS